MFGVFSVLGKVGRGRKVGNKLAQKLGIDPRLFHAAIEQGGLPLHLPGLDQLASSGMSDDEMINLLLPHVREGFTKLELRFGSQPQIEEAIEAIIKWDITH